MYKIGDKIVFKKKYNGKIQIAGGEVLTKKTFRLWGKESRYLTYTRVVGIDCYGRKSEEYECFWIKESDVLRRLKEEEYSLKRRIYNS